MNDYVNYTSKPISNCAHFHYFVSLLLLSPQRHSVFVGGAAMAMCAERLKNRKGLDGGVDDAVNVYRAENPHFIMNFFFCEEIVKFCMESSRQPDYHS